MTISGDAFTLLTNSPNLIHLGRPKRYFEDSIQKDPNFALAYAGLADTYVFLAYAGALQKDLAYRSAKNALSKALNWTTASAKPTTPLAC